MSCARICGLTLKFSFCSVSKNDFITVNRYSGKICKWRLRSSKIKEDMCILCVKKSGFAWLNRKSLSRCFRSFVREKTKVSKNLSEVNLPINHLSKSFWRLWHFEELQGPCLSPSLSTDKVYFRLWETLRMFCWLFTVISLRKLSCSKSNLSSLELEFCMWK